VPLTTEQRVQAVIDAPIGTELHRPDTRVVVHKTSARGWHQVITPSAPHGMLNEVVFSDLPEDDVERVIDETIAEYGAAGQPTKWCVGPWTRPADLGERLARRGFTGWAVRGMGCATDLSLSSAAGVVVDVVDESSLEDYLEATLEGWSMSDDQREPERIAHLAELRRSPPSAWFFTARVDGRVVGTAGLFARQARARACGYLVGGVVLPAARGRGAYRALVGARLAFLRSRGVEYAVTQAREATSAPMLEHLGFETLLRSTCWRKE
jgi:GNAT superfamily N-acetyltransferase